MSSSTGAAFDGPAVTTAIDRAVRTVTANVAAFGDRYPDDTTSGGVYRLRSRPGLPDGANTGWTTGFWPGTLWLAHEHTGADDLAAAALGHVDSFARRITDRVDIDTHDLGFLYTLSCVVAAERTGDATARRAGVDAAERLLDRYLPAAGVIQAWGSLDEPRQRGRTIIDSLMNTPLLHWAGRVTGRPRYAEAAHRHVANLRDHIFRPDGSTFHTFTWNPTTGEPERGGTEQGDADESCWARGQAWGIYGFALNHRLSGDPTFLAASRRCADHYLSRLDDGPVPRWDLSFDAGSGVLRDSSAAAIAAAGLLELDAADPGAGYGAVARDTLATLAADHTPPPGSDSNALLLHGVYDLPKGIGVDEGTLWGDYFYLEALLRLAHPGRRSHWFAGAPDDGATAAAPTTVPVDAPPAPPTTQPPPTNPEGDTTAMKHHCYLDSGEGLNTLPTNPCDLLDFATLRLSSGQRHEGGSGDREILAVILGGTVDVEVGPASFPAVGGRPNVFSGKPHSVFIPPGSAYAFTAVTDVEIALPSAPSVIDTAPYVIGPDRVADGRWGAANFSRTYHQILTEAAQPDLPAQRLIVGETYTPSGNWSTYPPHRHTADDLPREARHEEMYYFRVNPVDGFGIARVVTLDGDEENFTVRNHAMQMMPAGYHTVVSAPGYTTYYLWFLAGAQRTQGAVDDPDVGWVARTVPMLRELGH